MLNQFVSAIMWHLPIASAFMGHAHGIGCLDAVALVCLYACCLARVVSFMLTDLSSVQPPDHCKFFKALIVSQTSAFPTLPHSAWSPQSPKPPASLLYNISLACGASVCLRHWCHQVLHVGCVHAAMAVSGLQAVCLALMIPSSSPPSVKCTAQTACRCAALIATHLYMHVHLLADYIHEYSVHYVVHHAVIVPCMHTRQG